MLLQPPISTLFSLHDALPIYGDGLAEVSVSHDKGHTWTTSKDIGAAFGIKNSAFPRVVAGDDDRAAFAFLGTRSEEHTSELQSQFHLVCRLLLEKKNTNTLNQ